MIRRKVSRKDYEGESYLAWNAFIDLIAIENYEYLTETQQTAHLIFWYYSEVSNGGHLQYFVNKSGERVKETIDALSKLKMNCHCKVLEEAYQYVLSNPIDEIQSANDFIIQANEGSFDDFDDKYYRCGKEPIEFLEEYLKQHFNEFIELI